MSSTLHIYSCSSFNSNNKTIELISKKLGASKIYIVHNPFANIKKINFQKRLSFGINNKNQELFKKYYLSGLKKKKIRRKSFDYDVHKLEYINRKNVKLNRILSIENLQKENNEQIIQNKRLTKDNKNGLFCKLKNIFCCINDLRD